MFSRGFSRFSAKPLILKACFQIQFFLSFRDSHFKGYVDYVWMILKIFLYIGWPIFQMKYVRPKPSPILGLKIILHFLDPKATFKLRKS